MKKSLLAIFRKLFMLLWNIDFIPLRLLFKLRKLIERFELTK